MQPGESERGSPSTGPSGEWLRGVDPDVYMSTTHAEAVTGAAFLAALRAALPAFGSWPSATIRRASATTRRSTPTPAGRWPWPSRPRPPRSPTIVTLAARHGVPIVPRGAGSGPVRRRHGRRRRPDARDHEDGSDPRDRRGEPGGRRPARRHQRRPRAAAAEHGLFYAPDPASFEICTIGGNLAENSGGLRCVKYGVDPRRRPRPGGRARRRQRHPDRWPDRQGRRRLRPDAPLRRLGGHARDHHRGHASPPPGRRRRSSRCSPSSPRVARGRRRRGRGSPRRASCR